MSRGLVDPIVKAWLEETSGSPYMTQQAVAEVMNLVPGTPQRGRRWPFTVPGRTRAPRHVIGSAIHEGRVRPMFSPAKAMMVSALALTIGGIALLTEPANSPPAANPAPALAPTESTGTKQCGPQVRMSSSQNSDDESSLQSHDIGGAWRQAAAMSDPRLQGTVYYSEDLLKFRSPAGLSVANGTIRIENEDGAWQGSSPYVYLTDGTVTTNTIVLIGEGAYEGLTALWEETFDNASCSSTIRGVIIEGDVPSAPEPYTLRG